MSGEDTRTMNQMTVMDERSQMLSSGAQPCRNYRTFGNRKRGGLITYCSDEKDLLLLIESTCGALCEKHFRSHPQDHPAVPFSGCSSKRWSCYLAEITNRAEDETAEWRQTYLLALKAPDDEGDEVSPSVIALSYHIPDGQFRITVLGDLCDQESVFKGTIGKEYSQYPARGITQSLQLHMENYHGEDNPSFVKGLRDVLAIASGKHKQPYMQKAEDEWWTEPSPLNEDAEELFGTIVSRLLQAQEGWPARYLANSEQSTL